MGTAKTSFMSLQLEALARDGMDIDDNVEDLKGAATSLYAGL